MFAESHPKVRVADYYRRRGTDLIALIAEDFDATPKPRKFDRQRGFPGMRASYSRWSFWTCESPQRPSAMLGRATFQQHAVVAQSNPARRQFPVHARRSARPGPRAAAAGVSRAGVRPIAFACPARVTVT